MNLQVHGRGRMYAPTPPQMCSWQSCVRPPGTSWRWKPVTAPAVATRAPSLQHWTMMEVSRRLFSLTFSFGWMVYVTFDNESIQVEYCWVLHVAVTNLFLGTSRHNSSNQIPPGKERRCQEAVFYWLSCDLGHSWCCTALHHSQETQGKEAEETKR